MQTPHCKFKECKEMNDFVAVSQGIFCLNHYAALGKREKQYVESLKRSKPKR
jgi:hypothetical protein